MDKRSPSIHLQRPVYDVAHHKENHAILSDKRRNVAYKQEDKRSTSNTFTLLVMWKKTHKQS